MHKEAFLHNDFVQLCNNVYYREADLVDHLDFIIARVRLQMFAELQSDLKQILQFSFYFEN